MESQLTAFVTLVCISGILNLYLGLNVFIKRPHYKNIAAFFIVYTGFISIYCFASAFGLMATTLEQVKSWTTVQYIGMPFAPPLGLLFIMKYLGMKLTKKRIFALLLIPVISLAMVATNDYHHLHYRSMTIDPAMGPPYVRQEIGIWYMIHGIYTFSCMFAALILVLSRWRETAGPYRMQLVALAVGQLIPIITAFLYLNGLTPSGVDPVPMVLWISSALYLWAVNSSHMFTIMPVAKGAIFNSINDGIMAVDESFRLIECNRACKAMFPGMDQSVIGKNFRVVWHQLTGELFPADLEAISFAGKNEITAGKLNRTYQIRVSRLENANYQKGHLIILTDITEMKSLQQQLEHQAYHDDLTDVFNRRAFFLKCGAEFTAAKDMDAPFTVILIDIDHFKLVNDTYGHHTGDLLLKHVADVCKLDLGKGRLFARYGGEEFVVSLMGSIEEGAEAAESLRREVEAKPLRTGSDTIAVTLSCGVACLADQPEETLYQLLNKADKALYAAKREGRNCVRIYYEETCR